MRHQFRRSGLVAILALASWGCATGRGWMKAGATEAAFDRDSYECAREATYTSRRAELADGTGPFREEAKTDKDLYRACMRARGYQFVEGGQWRGFRD